MAKLTAEQKAKNKVEQKARDRAFRARRKEYEVAMDAAIVAFHKESDLLALSEAARKASEAALDAREAERVKLRGEIAAIESQIRGLNEKHNTVALNAARIRTNGEYFKNRSLVEAGVDATYSDIAGVYSPVQWVSSKEKS